VASFQALQAFLVGLAGGALALVVDLSCVSPDHTHLSGCVVADLGDRNDVQGVVQLAVAGEVVPGLVEVEVAVPRPTLLLR
jgi:hypothetical protein